MICGEKLKINLLLKQLFMRLKSAFLSRAMLLLIFLVVFSNTIFATNYYVSSSLGNDSNSGLSESSPWRTLTKVNSVTFRPGDRILFKVGDTFFGSISVKSSGTSSARISYEYYGSGSMPIISGFQTITGWKSLGNGVYSAPTNASNSLNMVTVNGVNTARGRYPNDSYLKFEKHVLNTSIVDNELVSAPNWTGANVVIRSARWRLENKPIISHLGNTLTFSPLITTPTDNFGYFITNDIKTLDQLGEWYCKNGTFYMYFGSNNPSNYQVNVSTLETLFEISNKSYVTVNGLAFRGANKRVINVLGSGSYGNQFRYCNISLSGGNGIESNSTASSLTIYKSTISEINDMGVFAWSKSMTISNCKFSNIGLFEGMGTYDGYFGIACNNDNSLIEYNSIINTGYVGIRFRGSNVTVKNNLVEKFCMVVDDGSGIYTAGQNYTNRTIRDNIILNGYGRPDGTNSTDLIVNGIYLDEPITGVVVSGNTVANCSRYGILLHESWGITLTNNTFFNNTRAQIGLAHDNALYPPQSNIHINNNIFFSVNATQWCLYFLSTLNDIKFGSASGNVYARPLKNKEYIYTKTASTAGAFRDLVSWRAFTGYDANSTSTPIILTSPEDIRIEYNASVVAKTISLSYPVIDARGVKYSGSLTLQPYTSVVLMRDPNSGLKSASISPTELGREDSLAAINIDLYPNPSTGKVTVRFSELPDVESRIDILNIAGTTVAARLVSSSSEVFDFSDQPSGLYLVKSTIGTKTKVQKLIINK